MPLAEQLSVRETVKALNGLEEEGDLHDEHDFGEFEAGGDGIAGKSILTTRVWNPRRRTRLNLIRGPTS